MAKNIKAEALKKLQAKTLDFIGRNSIKPEGINIIACDKSLLLFLKIILIRKQMTAITGLVWVVHWRTRGRNLILDQLRKMSSMHLHQDQEKEQVLYI